MANKVSKYLKNLDKETTQAGNAGETLKKAKGTPKGKAAANKLRNERGQMFGALLQGRRYDEKGKQIKKPKVNTNTGRPISKPIKPTTKTPSKTTTKTPVKKKVTVMPDKISPSKMTPAQKARYLKNPERYDG
jgi:hypothetical protein